MTTILITGASGFIGKKLCAYLSSKDFDVKAVVRNRENAYDISGAAKIIAIGDMTSMINWAALLKGVEVVIHLAACVHQKGIKNSLYQKINVEVTRELSLACSKAGVRRFIFISSVKAMGESTERGEVWMEATPPCPQDAYGRSKLAAERVLIEIGKETNLEVVILRFPLVYGAGVKANMEKLVKLVKSGVPLPFKSLKNKRSLLHVGNAVDAIRCCITHPAAIGETFLLSDGEDVSTPELIRQIAGVLGRPTRLFSFPPNLLRFMGRISGQSHVVGRLLDSLVVDSSKIQRVLSWKPPYSFKEGLRGIFEAFC